MFPVSLQGTTLSAKKYNDSMNAKYFKLQR